MTLSDTNVNEVEKAFNEALAVPLKQCGDSYYPASDEQEIKKAFKEMVVEILNTKGPAVNIVE
jgi:hypothetical protein